MKSEQSDRAEYIGQLTEELSQMAKSSGFNLLAFILDMARDEANRLKDGAGSRAHDIEAN